MDPGALTGARIHWKAWVAAAIRIGTCSWADKGLLEAWYPRGVSTAEKRLRYYAERFDVVEVDYDALRGIESNVLRLF